MVVYNVLYLNCFLIEFCCIKRAIDINKKSLPDCYLKSLSVKKEQRAFNKGMYYIYIDQLVNYKPIHNIIKNHLPLCNKHAIYITNIRSRMIGTVLHEQRILLLPKLFYDKVQ